MGGDSAAAAAAAAADRRRLERFAAGEPAAAGTATAASSRSSSPATDASLRGASRESSFVFVRPSAAQLPVGSPLRFPAAAGPPAGPAPTPAAATAAPASAPKPKPSPASQQASFRGWANLFKEPQGAAAASSPTTPEDVVAAKFLEATKLEPGVSGAAQGAHTASPASPFMQAPPASPFSSPATAQASAPVVAPAVSPFTAAPHASPFITPEAAAPPPKPVTAATAPARLLAMPAPLASPFEVLQAETPSDSAFQSAVEEPVSSKGSSQGPSSREQQDSTPSSREQMQPGSSAGRDRTDHDRHKEHRPSSSGWKAKFRRGGRREEPDREALAADAKAQGDADAEKDKHGRKSRHSRHKSGRSSLKELFRGSGSHDSGPLCPGKKVCDEAAAQPEAAPATAASSEHASRSKSVIMRFKDAFLSGPHTTGPLAPLDSAATAAAHQVGKFRHAAKPAADAAQHVLFRDTQLDEAWGKPAAAAAAGEGTHRGGKRSSGRRSRNRDRGRPGRGDRSQRGALPEGDRSRLGAAQGAASPAERGQPLTAAALAKLNGLVLPWEGHPYWQVCPCSLACVLVCGCTIACMSA